MISIHSASPSGCGMTSFRRRRSYRGGDVVCGPSVTTVDAVGAASAVVFVSTMDAVDVATVPVDEAYAVSVVISVEAVSSGSRE